MMRASFPMRFASISASISCISTLFEAQRRDQKVACVLCQAFDRKIIEHGCQLGADAEIGRDKRKVRILLRRSFSL